MKSFSKAFIAAMGLSSAKNIFDPNSSANPTLKPLTNIDNPQPLYPQSETQAAIHNNLSTRNLLQEVNNTENNALSPNITKKDLSVVCLDVINGFDNLNKAEKETLSNMTIDMVNNKFADSDIKTIYDYLAYGYEDPERKEKAATRIFSRTGIPISDASDILYKLHQNKGHDSSDLISNCVNPKFRDERKKSDDKTIFTALYSIAGFAGFFVVSAICCGIIQCISNRRIAPAANGLEPSTQVAYNNLEDNSPSNVSAIGYSPSSSKSEIRTTSSPSASPRTSSSKNFNKESPQESIEMV